MTKGTPTVVAHLFNPRATCELHPDGRRIADWSVRLRRGWGMFVCLNPRFGAAFPMLQTLFHIPREVAGLPVFGWGLLFWLWLVGGAIYLGWLYKRAGAAEVWGSLPLLAAFAAAIVWLFPRMCDEIGLPIRGYGALVVAAVVAGAALAAARAALFGFSVDLVVSLVTWMFVPGVIGARLLYVVEYWQEFQGATAAETLVNALKLTEGGLVVYGAVIGCLAGTLAFVWRYGVPLAPLLDLIAPSAALAMGIGRIGCFLNGCCYGGPADLPWAVQFPYGSPPFEHQARRGDVSLLGVRLAAIDDRPAEIAAVESESPAQRAGLQAGQRIVAIDGRETRSGREAWGQFLSLHTTDGAVELRVAGQSAPLTLHLPRPLPRSRPIHPTQLYSAVDGSLLALLLVALTPYRRKAGEIFAAFLVSYAVTRFLLEIIRTDEGALLGTGLTISQNVSVLVLAGGVLWWVYVWTRTPARAS